MKVKGVVLVLLLVVGGCVSRAPTIAHVHIGHAITGVHVTPNKEGYLVTAERRGAEAADLAHRAAASNDLTEIKQAIAAAVQATDFPEGFGVKQAIVMAANHVTFAATSDDASINLQRAAPGFASDITRVVERCDLIVLLGKDVQASQSVTETAVPVAEIGKLTEANLTGEYGLAQLRKELEAVIARESPPYVTVPQWYLFNLVRLPNGKWVFDKLGRGGNIDGYK